jgi:hypothetical protein
VELVTFLLLEPLLLMVESVEQPVRVARVVMVALVVVEV